MSLLFQQFPEFRQRACIGHVLRLQTGAPGLVDSELHKAQLFNRMGVGSDHDADAPLLGGGQQGIVQIKPIRLRVQLQEAAMVRGCFEHRVQIHQIALALADQPARGMTDCVHIAIADRVQKALRDLLLFSLGWVCP